MTTMIREATPEDAVLLAELNAAVQIHHAEGRPDRFKMPVPNDPELIAIFEQHLQTEGTFIYIAEVDDKAVGYSLCQVIERVENPFTFAFKVLLVDQVSVNASHRGQGIGQILMDKADELAATLEIEEIVLDVHAFNKDAFRFYERLGFASTMIRMRKTL